ncbi:hypothetical protein EVAR_22025_1 [Eumeta japonica]|uniref:Uncharacterized protein n=1 Tax=Eumeta variegata TaxID=151549 RepID=A0A4C1USG4_EUMVA|nr:hypothetical protein EVAR_22025_1 [Eumeta japonica]
MALESHARLGGKAVGVTSSCTGSAGAAKRKTSLIPFMRGNARMNLGRRYSDEPRGRRAFPKKTKPNRSHKYYSRTIPRASHQYFASKYRRVGTVISYSSRPAARAGAALWAARGADGARRDTFGDRISAAHTFTRDTVFTPLFSFRKRSAHYRGLGKRALCLHNIITNKRREDSVRLKLGPVGVAYRDGRPRRRASGGACAAREQEFQYDAIFS